MTHKDKISIALLGACLAAGLLATLGAGGAKAAVGQDELVRIIRTQSALIETQKARIDRLEQRLERVESAIRMKPAAPATVSAAPRPPATPDPAPAHKVADDGRSTVVEWNGGPEIQSPDGSFSFKPIGRVMTDLWTTTGSGVAGRNITGTEIRRARFGFEGKLHENVNYKAEVDFADDDVSVKSVYMAWAQDNWEVYAGQRTVDRSLDGKTSSKYLQFMERPLAVVGTRPEFGRQAAGAGATIGSKHWHASASVSGDEIDNPGDVSDSVTAAVRATAAPVNGDGKLIHLGGWAYFESFNAPMDVDEATRLGNHFNDNVRAVSGTVTDADYTYAYGLELAGAWGAASFSAEYAAREIDGSGSGRSDVRHDGFYVAGGVFLTGESRPYSGKRGSWKRVKPREPVADGGVGAWEIAARYDYVDYGDAGLPGDVAQTFTLALNWHLISYSRIMANWVYWDIDGPVDDSGHHFGIRAQVDW